MTFFTIILRGLTRRPVRTGLTLVGISIGIGAVVALVGISRGFEKGWESGLKARGTDIVVSNLGSALTPKPFNEAARERVAKVPRVAAVCAVLVELISVEDAPIMMVSAREWGGFSWHHLKLTAGRLPRDGAEPAVVLGLTAAEVLRKKVGDPIQIETEELTVAGIVDGGGSMENGSVILSLALLQKITGNEGKINVLDVALAPATGEEAAKRVCAEINTAVPEARASLASEHVRSSQGFQLIRAMSWGTSLLAVLVGVLGVMNTMLMTVFERTHEICVLLAIGWRRSRIVRMVLWESALLGLLGGIGGVAIGAVGVRFMEMAPAIRGLLVADLSPGLMLTAVAIAILVGVISGLYPAWRSSRLTPSAALQG